MFRYSKLNSVQAGPFKTPSNRMIDIEIPEGVMCNMANSFVQLLLHLETDATNVVNLCHRSTTTNFVNMNLDLIRNCSLTGSKVGRLEDIRRVNVLKHNLNLMSKSSDEKLSLVDSLYQMTNFYSNSILSLFVDFNKEGTIASQYRDVDLRIPLKDLFELGSLEMIDTSKTGKLTLHLELENSSYISVEQIALMNDPDEGKCENVAQSANLSQLITKTKYPNLELSPFYVGAVYNLNAIKSGGAVPNVVNVPTTITGIVKNTDGSLTLGITPSLPDPTGSFNWGAVVLSEIQIMHTSSIIVETAEIGLSEIVGGSQSSMNELSYMTFTTEEYTNGSQATMNKIFEVEPECVNAFLMFDNNSSNLISNKTTLKSYRMRVDNQDIYRDILTNKENAVESYIHDNLHYDSIYRTFLNGNIPLKDMSFLSLKRNVDTDEYQSRFTASNQQIMICCCPTPLSPLSKKLQFNLVCEDGTIDNVILYKQVMRTIKF